MIVAATKHYRRLRKSRAVRKLAFWGAQTFVQEGFSGAPISNAHTKVGVCYWVFKVKHH